MKILFTPTKIGALEVNNRFVRSATYDAGAEDSRVSDWQINLYRTLARGGVGLIISGIFHVTDLVAKIAPTQNLLTNDEFIPGLKRLAVAVHEHGSKLAVQLYHPGREAFRRLKPLGIKTPGPSAIEEGEDPYFEGSCREMTVEEIWTTVKGFGEAAARVQEAGCDAVQIHGAHAYLMAEFLSPRSNSRNDEWGGELNNRLKIHREIYKAVREKVGPDYPVMIKLGVADGFPGGLEFKEGLDSAVQLAELGYDSIEVSQGLRGTKWAQTEFRDKIVKREREAYFRDWARQVKERTTVPVMMVGGLRSLDLMEKVVESKEADFVSLCRPLIKEPNLVTSWRDGQPRRPTCISCNKCFENVLSGSRLRCMLKKSGLH
ncbi:MAG: NADH oxidase [Syntrophorhabdaceae bacterium PtaU1.Bin034]|jgi:2,4-dienoyl-CoA reductase-like NADH-dependent reductase (Old Yellow Enzyme family)|nr:MAG: NADH oxidase [Syntrophorhabdaceae bacterium PtaU1.Bin034]